MPRVSLLVRIPSDLKQHLMQLAAAENRSLNQQIEFLLRRALDTKQREHDDDKRQR